MKALTLAAALLFCCVTHVVGVQAQESNAKQQQLLILQAANVNDQDHLMTKANFLELHRIQDGVHKSGVIADADLDWVSRLMAHPESKGNAFLASVDTMAALGSLKNPPQYQKDKIRLSLIPMLTADQRNDEYGLDKLFAANLVQVTGDKQAIPYLIPLLQDRRPDVQKRARHVLLSLGYTPRH